MSPPEARVETFVRDRRRPGEAVLGWIPARSAGREGVAILTDRRLCFFGGAPAGEALDEISVTGDALSYQPPSGEAFAVAFRTDEGELAFEIDDPEEEVRFGNFLGNIADLREAQRDLVAAGLSPDLVTPAREGEREGLPAVYKLMRLKEMALQGLLGELELAYYRAEMLDRFRSDAGARPFEPPSAGA